MLNQIKINPHLYGTLISESKLQITSEMLTVLLLTYISTVYAAGKICLISLQLIFRLKKQHNKNVMSSVSHFSQIEQFIFMSDRDNSSSKTKSICSLTACIFSGVLKQQ
jgi:hypothetical protein